MCPVCSKALLGFVRKNHRRDYPFAKSDGIERGTYKVLHAYSIGSLAASFLGSFGKETRDWGMGSSGMG